MTRRNAMDGTKDAGPSPQQHVEGEETCILCGQTTCDVCQELDNPASSAGYLAFPSKDDVLHALETIQRANGADLDEWTHGVLPSDTIQEALVAIKISREEYNAR